MIAAARTAFLGALLGLLSIWLLDATRHTEVPPLVRVARAEPTRLIVLFVDSLSDRDVRTQGAMPRLAARLQRGGLHGPVQPCADAITVPCMTAAITGNDQLSVFALGTNFASGSSVVASSVLGQLQRAGHGAGYLGEHILAKTMTGLSFVMADLEGDEQVLAQLSRALERQDLDLLIVHFGGLDQTAHKYGDAAPEYAAARARVDAQIEAVVARLPPSDHVLVMGDHGHTASGRHAAGLDTTTYAAYLGPQFGRKLETPMLMTEHAAIWARIFGFSRSTPGWLEDYYAGREPRPRGATSQSSRLPLWALLTCVLLASATCLPSLDGTPRERYRALGSFVASLALMAGLGAVWPDIRGFIWDSSLKIQLARVASTIASGLLGSGLLVWLRSTPRDAPRTWHDRCALALAAAIVFALPTVYVGGPSVVQSWLALALFGYAFWFGAKGGIGRTAQLVLGGLLVVSLLPVKHANYVLRGFTVYTRLLPALSAYALPSFAVACVLFALLSGRLVRRDQPASWLAVALGAVPAACAGVVSDRWFILPCVLALPLLFLALRWPRWTPVAVACAIPAVWFSYGGSLRAVTPIFVVWLLCALLPRVFRHSDPALRGAILLSLVLMSFRTAMGCRIAGIDFDFFFRFLPPDVDVTAYWIPSALFTTAKYLLPPTLGLLLTRAHDPDLARALHAAAWMGRARVGMCVFFLLGLVVMKPAAGAAIVGDASQEAAIWVIALALLGIVSLACQPRAEA
jgi:hypothetical protein